MHQCIVNKLLGDKRVNMECDYYSTPQKWEFGSIKQLYLNNIRKTQTSVVDFKKFERYEGIMKEKLLLQELSERLTLPDFGAIEVAVNFIVAPVYFYYSGHIKESMARRLKNCELSSNQVSRVVKGIDALSGSDNTGLEFKQLKKLKDKLNNAT